MSVKILGNQNLYVKGTANFDYLAADGTVMYHTSALQTSQINTSINLGAINGGLGNLLLINIPDTPDMSVNLTAANFSIEAQAYNVGADLYGGGKAPTTESVTIGANGVGRILGIPVAPHGTTDLIGTIKKVKKADGTITEPRVGTTFTLSTDGAAYEFTYDGAEQGDTVCVEYYYSRPDIIEAAVADIVPKIGKGRLELALYSSSDKDNPENGTRVGSVYVTIPRMQWTGEMNIEGSSTANSNTVVNAKALASEDDSTLCGDGVKKLCYITVVIFNNDWTTSTQQLVAIGAPVSVAVDGTKKLVIKGIEDGNRLNNVDASNLDFTSSETGVATVDATGTVKGVASGDTTITVEPKSSFSNPNGLSLEVSVTVTE